MILVEDLHEIFDLWLDKVDAPYFTSNQRDKFLQRASIQFLNQYFKNPSSHVLEDTHVDLEDVHSLVYPVRLISDEQGRVNFTDINGGLPTGKEWMYFLNAARGKTADCKDAVTASRWVRHNEFYTQQRNDLVKAESEYPIHRYFSDYMQFNPSGRVAVEVTVLMKPNALTLDDPNDTRTRGANAVDLDLPDKVFNEIVYLALIQAGVNMREQEFYASAEREVGKNV